MTFRTQLLPLFTTAMRFVGAMLAEFRTGVEGGSGKP
jgi:hypothetical protein